MRLWKKQKYAIRLPKLRAGEPVIFENTDGKPITMIVEHMSYSSRDGLEMYLQDEPTFLRTHRWSIDD